MYKLDYNRQKNQRSNCQHLMDNRRKAWEFKKNTYFCFTDYLKFLTVLITTNWEILIEMGIPDHLTCLLRNMHAGQEATVRTGHGKTTCSKLGKEYIKTVYYHLAYLTYMWCTSCERLG